MNAKKELREIARVLRKAVDERLSYDTRWTKHKSPITSVALRLAGGGRLTPTACRALEGMILMGEETFCVVPNPIQRQYARALWLTWAALMAEEQAKGNT